MTGDVYRMKPVEAQGFTGFRHSEAVMKLCIAVFVAGFVIASPSLPQEKTVHEAYTYIDADKDNHNDVFLDADGDGVNDVDGLRYRHNFQFVDKNGDGINDVFRDANGDGVNDLDRKKTGAKKGEYREFLDADGDGVNDITGKTQKDTAVFRDEDGDGIDDAVQMTSMNQAMRQRGKDVFVDSDGDGINDGRDFSRERRRIGGYGGEGNGHGPGNGSGGGNGGKQNRGDK